MVKREGARDGRAESFRVCFFYHLSRGVLTICERLDIDYKSASSLGEYEPPKSVWEMYGDS
jgi:hypothetical protein